MYVLWDSSCFVITFRIALERSALGGPRRCQILFSHLSFPTFATCANSAQVDKSNGHWQSNFRRCNGYFAAELGAPRRWDFRGAYQHTWGGCHFWGSKPRHFVTFVRLWVWKPHFDRLRSVCVAFPNGEMCDRSTFPHTSFWSFCQRTPCRLQTPGTSRKFTEI